MRRPARRPQRPRIGHGGPRHGAGAEPHHRPRLSRRRPHRRPRRRPRDAREPRPISRCRRGRRRAEALRAVAAAKPDVAMLDLEMPGIGGLDAIPDLLAAVAAHRDPRLHHVRNASYVTRRCMRAPAAMSSRARASRISCRDPRGARRSGYLQPEITGPLIRRAVADGASRRGGHAHRREMQVVEAVAGPEQQGDRRRDRHRRGDREDAPAGGCTKSSAPPTGRRRSRSRSANS